MKGLFLMNILTPTYKRISVDEFLKLLDTENYTEFAKLHKYEKWVKYHMIYCGFDIETTTINEKAYMYKWQFGYKKHGGMQYVVSGRTWSEFARMIRHLKRKLALRDSLRLIVWIANFSYEFQFIRKIIDMTDIFAKTSRNPLYAYSDGIEFRDCLAVSQGSLAYLAKCWTNTQKLKGDLDYSILRNSKTPLTEKEDCYCDNDVIILSEFSEKIFSQYLIPQRYIPFTSTAILRHDLREKAVNSTSHKEDLFQYIKSLFPKSKEDYLFIMTFLFRGGYVHANYRDVGKNLYGMDSFDFKSSYPARAFKGYYPVKEFTQVDNVSRETLETLCNKYCVIFTATFEKLSATTTHSIESKNKCIDLRNPLIDNGRIRKADSMTVMLTELDYDSYNQFYTWDTMVIHTVMIAPRGNLPRYLLDQFYYWFDKKESINKEENPQDYGITKTRINGHFGLCVTRLVFNDIVFSDGKWTLAPVTKTYEEMIDKQVLSPYWGIYMTAHARHEILYLLYELKEEVSYSDTDSHKLKLTRHAMQVIHEYNKREKQANIRLCEKYGYDINILRNIGCLEWETSPKGKHGRIKRFKTLGAKRYINEYEKDGFSSTISGLSKDALNKFCEDNDIDPFVAFDNGMAISSEYNKKLTPIYINEPSQDTVTDSFGNTETMKEYSSVYLKPTEFTLSMDGDYINLIMYNLERKLKHG